MIYLTYNDLPSGIYFGQVIDVCLFIKKKLNVNIRLVAFISVRGYWKHRKQIKNNLGDAIVIPMFPRHKNWKLNVILLKILLLKIGKQKAICRGVFTTNMALQLKRENLITKVVFDARGAYKPEFEEYLNKTVHIKEAIADLEKTALLESDFRLAVSQKLVAYWKREYNYTGSSHVIIPCTINSDIDDLLSEKQMESLRKDLGYSATDIILVYSGSSADWQSLRNIDSFLLNHLNKYPGLKIILLSQFDLNALKSYKQFRDRISQKWLKQHEVHNYLSIADYGLMIREHSVTNEVASPTKFAEYLNAGLKIILSKNIGDFSDFVEKNNAGVICENENKIVDLYTIDYSEKKRMSELSINHFTKDIYQPEYKKITD